MTARQGLTVAVILGLVIAAVGAISVGEAIATSDGSELIVSWVFIVLGSVLAGFGLLAASERERSK